MRCAQGHRLPGAARAVPRTRQSTALTRRRGWVTATVSCPRPGRGRAERNAMTMELVDVTAGTAQVRGRGAGSCTREVRQLGRLGPERAQRDRRLPCGMTGRSPRCRAAEFADAWRGAVEYPRGAPPAWPRTEARREAARGRVAWHGAAGERVCENRRAGPPDDAPGVERLGLLAPAPPGEARRRYLDPDRGRLPDRTRRCSSTAWTAAYEQQLRERGRGASGQLSLSRERR